MMMMKMKRQRSEEEHAMMMKIQRSDVEHAISHLPDDVLGSLVVSRLSLRDAVHTSLVSSTWRPLFTFRSHLCFDREAIFNRPHKHQNGPVSRTRRHQEDRCTCVGDTVNFVKAVNQFLDSYCNNNSSTSVLDSFKIKFCLDARFGRDIDQWVSFAIKRSVKKLVLDLSCRQSFSERQTMDENCDFLRYTLGSGLQHPNMASKLEDLELRSCNLDENIISQLLGSSLKSVKLTKVPLGREEVLHSICCRCPKLQSLVLENSRLPPVVRISNHTLETLSIRDCFGFEEIEVSGSNLVSFEYSGTTLVKLSFRGVPNLSNVCLISQHGVDLYQKLNELGTSVPAMKDLAICAEHANLETSIIPTFRHVEQLKLCLTRTRHFDMMRVINILRAFPRLQKLHLAIWCTDDVEEGEKNIAPAIVHKHLKEVEISGFRCCENNIEFVINLLKFADLSLKTLSIKPQMQVLKTSEHWEIKGDDTWDEGEREMVVEELQDYFSQDKHIMIGL